MSVTHAAAERKSLVVGFLQYAESLRARINDQRNLKGERMPAPLVHVSKNRFLALVIPTQSNLHAVHKIPGLGFQERCTDGFIPAGATDKFDRVYVSASGKLVAETRSILMQEPRFFFVKLSSLSNEELRRAACNAPAGHMLYR